jgi:TetR/AcrR family transcriptional repressor of nem operon
MGRAGAHPRRRTIAASRDGSGPQPPVHSMSSKPSEPSRARSPGRPPHHGAIGSTRERLLQAGLEVAMQGGLRAVTVRALTERAQANAGSFVYHFGTRELFLAELVERWYTPFQAGLQLATADAADPLGRLRQMLATLAVWAVQHGGFVAGLMADAAAGETVAREFLATLPARHPALLLKAVRDCQAAGLIEAGPPQPIVLFLAAAIALPPVFAAGLFDGPTALPRPVQRELRRFVGEPAALQRLDWALRGLAPPPAPAPGVPRRGRARR